MTDEMIRARGKQERPPTTARDGMGFGFHRWAQRLKEIEL